MSRPGQPNESRGQLGAWLKMAVRSTLLDRVPPDYEPACPGTGGPTRDHARDLLARFQALDPWTSPPGEVLDEIRTFRTWVEGRLKASRRIILGGASGGDVPVHRLDSAKRPTPRRRNPPDDPPGIEPDPMWDRWLDG